MFLSLASFWNKLSRRAAKTGARRRAASGKSQFRPRFEALEERQLLTTLSPIQVRQYYGFDRVGFVGATHGFQVGDGRNTTIAIVDAYDDPNIRADLAAFDALYKIPAPPSFTVVNQRGGASLPGPDPGQGTPGAKNYRAPRTWEQETALDVEYVHAIAPGADILLVEANTSGSSDLYAAASYAASHPGVVVVSMSWGNAEFSGETSRDGPFNHAGVTFVASTGDTGTPGNFPAFSPNVVAVGGTTLDYGTAAGYSEKGWNKGVGNRSGGGISQYESQPAYQKGVVTQSTTRRTIPDAAFSADSVWVYDTYGGNGTYSQGGTSLSAPIMAGLVSIIDQGRSYVSGQAAYNSQDFLTALYQLPADAFNDVTTGGNGTYNCGPGYDLVTGRGTPLVPRFVAGLAGDTVQAPAGMVKWAGWSTFGGQYAVALTASNQLEVFSNGTWSVIDTNVKDFGVVDVYGTPNLVYLLTNGELRARTDMSGAWTNIDPVNDVQSMAVDGNGWLYVLSFANHGVWRYDGDQIWTNVDPVNDVQSIAVDGTGALYALSFANHGVWRFDGGQSWSNVDPVNDVQSLVVDNTGTLYVLSFANHGVWQFNPDQSWTNIDPVNDVRSMVVDNTGTLYVLSFANHGV